MNDCLMEDEDFKKIDVLQRMDLEGEKKDLKTLNKAFWFGKDLDVDQSIINYLNMGNNSKFGASYHNLVCRFVYELQIMNERRLRKRLQQLKKRNMIRSDYVRGVVFFVLVKDK